MQSHQVETEAVDVVFLRPVGDGIDHVFAEHQVLGCGVVAAARAVGKAAVVVHAVVVIRYRILEPRIGRIGVVVDNVHDDADARVVKRLDHLLAFLDAHIAVVGIGGIGALGAVVVDGIIAPIVLLHDVLALVDGAEIIHGHDLDVLHAQLFEVVHAGRRAAADTVDGRAVFGEGEEFAPVRLHHAAGFRGREVRDGDLPYRSVRLVRHTDVTVILPVVGIGLGEVDDH